jgi:hypothetical protein
VSVSYADGEPNGLASLLGELIQQNLQRDPSRHRLLRPGVVAIESTDALVAASLRFGEGSVEVANGMDPAAGVRVRAPGGALLGLAGAPLRFGLPDVASKEGRAVVADIARGRIRVQGLITRAAAVRRLTMLLSAN